MMECVEFDDKDVPKALEYIAMGQKGILSDFYDLVTVIPMVWTLVQSVYWGFVQCSCIATTPGSAEHTGLG